GNDVMIHSPSSMDLLTEIELDTADRNILSLVNSIRRVRDILARAPGNEIDTLRTLYALRCTGIIESAETEQEPPQEDTRFFEKVRDLHTRLADIDYYNFLGIEKRATLDMIRKAYYQAVKEFHPDKHLHLPSDTLKNQLNMIFSHLIEAYRVLSNPATRLQYDQGQMINPSSLQTNNTEMARIKFMEGKAEFKNGAYDRAKELFEQALYLDATIAPYSYYMALVLEYEKRYNEAGKMLNQALKIEPFNADYLAELGHVYLHLGFPLRAKSTFEKALQTSPSHKKALEGLRQITG
ncbi:MAG: DnaJ domain-containing protein, partial [Thermodesulfovibrionales bacterium]|nr:DnaJ domain-containing protein [Thermodesulfovibrionales bacterium]